MIVSLACTCGSSEELIRQALHRYGYKNWAMEPIYQGKENCLASVENMLKKFPNNHRLEDLYAHINNNSKWAVFLGYDENGLDWADIALGRMKEDVEAEAVVRRYGK